MATRRRSILSALSLALLLVPSAALAQRVVVERAPATVERRQFNPRRPPREMPPLGGDADAVTEVRFGCSSAVQSTVLSRRRARGGAGKCVGTVRVTGVTVKLDLKITIWVPTNARQKLIDHEEGHRVIAERIYDEFAEDVARAAAGEWVGKTVSGEAADCTAAAQAALGRVNEALGEAYMKGTAAVHGRVGARYDEITDHGRREVGEAEAIERAFRREREDRR